MNYHKDDEAAALRSGMVANLAKKSSYANRAILDAMDSVPRECFAPSFFLYADGGNRLLRESIDATDWLTQAYRDQSLTTQLDGKTHADDVDPEGGPWQGAPTCSASQPSLVARMLDMLMVEPGNRVLEIGTGTGYNAALLCELTGSRNVYTVEYDDTIAAKAEEHLSAAGYRPSVIVGDGGIGLPEAAPFDAIITTCSFPAIHPAWLEQLSPDGIAVVNLVTGLPIGILTALGIEKPGEATGRIVSQRAWFMPTRTEPTGAALRLSKSAEKAGGEPRPTDLRWPDVEASDGLYVLAALLMDAHLLVSFTEDGGKQYELLADDGSVAVQQSGTVTEGGPRRLWAQLEEVAQVWTRLGQPERDDFELSISYGDSAATPTVVHTRSDWTAPAVGITLR